MTEIAPERRRELLLLAGLTAVAGMAAGAISLSEGRILTLSFELSAPFFFALPIAIVLVHAMARRPEVGLHVLIVLAYSNGSEVLVRLGLPSVLQLLVPVLLLILTWTALRESATGELRAPPRLLVLFALTAALYVAWAWLSTAWATEPSRGLRACIELGKAVMLAIVVAFVANRPGRLRRAAWSLLTVGAVLAAMSSWQVVSGHWEQSFLGLARVKNAHIAGHVFRPRTTGPLADPNFYAQMLLPLFPIGLAVALSGAKRRLRVIALAMAAIVGLGIVTTYSRGGALALAMAMGLFLLLERNRVKPIQALVVVMLGLSLVPVLPDTFWNRLSTLEVLLPGEAEGLQSHDSSVNKRKLVMGAAALMALDNPVAGVGFGNYTTRFYSYADQIGADGRVYNLVGARAYAHSLPLEILAETGLVGFLLFALAVALALLSARRARERFLAAGDESAALLARALAIGLVAMLISSLILHGDYPRHIWIVLGLCAGSIGAAARKPEETAA